MSFDNPGKRPSTTISDICERCRDLDDDQRKVLRGMIEELLALDLKEKNAFRELLDENGYGSISLIYKAGECIGLDWQSSHRTHEL